LQWVDRLYADAVRLEIRTESVEVRLSWWQNLLGLMRDISVPLRDIDAAEVIDDAVRVAGRSGIKVGLRVPFLYFVARTMRLDEAFIVRRGVPGLSISIGGEGHLRRLLVSTPRAAEFAEEIEAARR
jgi:hypothetical protein